MKPWRIHQGTTRSGNAYAPGNTYFNEALANSPGNHVAQGAPQCFKRCHFNEALANSPGNPSASVSEIRSSVTSMKPWRIHQGTGKSGLRQRLLYSKLQ